MSIPPPKYDITLFGATGFTGRLAVQYVFENYGSKLRWAIAGRSEAKLMALAKESGGSPGVIVADSDDVASLEAMASQSKVVVSFAGPFGRYGSKLVSACARAGVDYCDITGEIDWVRDMIEAHDDTARSTGARIVPLCGHDSVPWDLMTMVLSRELKEANASEQLLSVDLWDKIRSSPSGGTLETALSIIHGGRPKKSALGYDPLLKSASGAAAACTLTANNVSRVTKEAGGTARGMFVMASVNAAAAKRSNALLGYGASVTYREGQAFSSAWKARKVEMLLLTMFVVLKLPWLTALCRSWGWLPKPGDGPSIEEMSKGFLHVTGEARGTEGGRVAATLTFPTDPGYKDTARMAVEAGLALALEGDRVSSRGGVLTPASCQGEVLLERLLASGSTLSVSPQDPPAVH